MTALTEIEIFDRMITSFRAAAQCCDDLAVLPAKGPTYSRLREHLKLIEGCCRQACYWREDARWLPLGFMMAEAHQRAGNWLRPFELTNGDRRQLTNSELHPCFVKLAENLRLGIRIAQDLKDKATGRTGMILPKPQALHRDTRPVQALLPMAS